MIQLVGQLDAIASCDDTASLEELRVRLLGKKGLVTEALKAVASLPVEERKEKGRELNLVKQEITTALDERKAVLDQQEESRKLAEETLDVTLSPTPWRMGKKHPISQVIDEVRQIFSLMGFDLRTGPLIEDEDHNFNALNIPDHHPARQMQDTFYINAPAHDGVLRYVLRTHTSPVQIRTMRNEVPPIRIIAPGSTFRSDSDQTHTPMFHQMEALYIDKQVDMGHLKGCVIQFLRLYFGRDDLKVRFRPSFFPFTEPSAEIDIGCKRGRDGIVIGEGDDWLEIIGCGMVHPNVLKACNLDSEIWQGFALGVGIERLAMLKYNIPDLRTFFESDTSWQRHYGF